jgi:hypothetical protein
LTDIASHDAAESASASDSAATTRMI